MNRKKGICLLISAILSSCLLGGCGVDDVADQAANIVQSEDEHVLSVKNGSPQSFPDKTYGDSFEEFFESPTWKYFKGTQEGPDEDGDGEPDYVNEDVDIVEFTGYCTYKDAKVKALIQFTLNDSDDTFQATYLSFNDVPQNMLVLGALLDKAFEDSIDSENNDSVDSENEGLEDSGIEDYNSVITAEFVRESLGVPEDADVAILYSEEYYWDAGGITVVDVGIEGSGKDEGHFASAEFDVSTGEMANNIYMWD